MSNINVSVIVPVHNTAEYLWDCFGSIFHQTLADIEVIAVDDGSTDDSMIVLEQIKAQNPGLIILSQENKKQGAARNTGLKIARGTYIYFMDSDDILDNDALENTFRICEKNGLDLVCFEGRIFGDIKGRNQNQYMFGKMSKQMNQIVNGREFVLKNYKTIGMLNVCLMLINRQFLLRNEMFFLEGIFYEDNEYYHRLMTKNPKMMLIDNVYYNRRYRANSTMTSEVDKFKIYCKVLINDQVFKMEDDELGNLYKSLAVKRISKIVNEQYEQVRKEKRVLRIVEEIFDEMVTEEINERIDLLSALYLIGVRLFQDKLPRIEDRLKTKLLQLCETVGLYHKEQIVGIYGMGKDSTLFLEMIERFYGNIPSNIIFIDTYAKSDSKKHLGHRVINKNDISNNNLFSILVASSKYEVDILKELREQELNQTHVFGLRRDFGYY